jgi:pimeloyl-ACP methyl ester carboxylesterase
MGIIFRFFFLLLVLSGCTSVIYQPDNVLYALPEQYKIKHDEISLKSMDGTMLAGWKLHSQKKPAKILLVFFHGNAQNMTSHFTNLAWLTDYEMDIIVFDYRGYGISEGKPNPKGVSEDGLSFLNFAYKDFKEGHYNKFIIYTHSLGGAIALKSMEEFTHNDEVNLLVLDSTFLSPRMVARQKAFWPLSLIISNNYTAEPELKHLTMPILSIHCTQDPVIAYELGLKLFNSITNSPKKRIWSFETPGHGNVFFVENLKYRKEFVDYIGVLN